MTHVSIVPYRSDIIVCAAPDQGKAQNLGATVADHLRAEDSHNFAVDDHRLSPRYGLDDRYRNPAHHFSRLDALPPLARLRGRHRQQPPLPPPGHDRRPTSDKNHELTKH